jgi:hypothetical protein
VRAWGGEGGATAATATGDAAVGGSWMAGVRRPAASAHVEGRGAAVTQEQGRWRSRHTPHVPPHRRDAACG